MVYHQNYMNVLGLINRVIDIETLRLTLINVITKLQLNINDIQGQGYDNGSNMKGNKQGLQTSRY